MKYKGLLGLGMVLLGVFLMYNGFKTGEINKFYYIGLVLIIIGAPILLTRFAKWIQKN